MPCVLFPKKHGSSSLDHQPKGSFAMNIRFAALRDADGIYRLLYQVAAVHSNGRPDIFRKGAKKYNDSRLQEILNNPDTPVFVAVNDDNYLLGYAFCVIEEIKDHPLLMDDKSLYIDDLCVEETMRGQHIGKALLEYVRAYAVSIGCRRMTLNVWECNPSARAFYDKNGFSVLKTTMEQMLEAE